MHIGWTYIGEWRQLWAVAPKGTLTPYQEQISLSKKTGVHEEEGNFQTLEERLEDQSWRVHGAIFMSCHGVMATMSWNQASGEWRSIPSFRVRLTLEVSIKRFCNIHHVGIYVFYPLQMDTYRDKGYTFWSLRTGINSVYSVSCVPLVSRS